MGTGMAFPWEVLRSVNLANAHLVEDLKLGLDLTLAGHPPLFCPSARVTSEFPSSVKGAGTQRRRWEQGHLDMILKNAPRTLALAIARRDWNLGASGPTAKFHGICQLPYRQEAGATKVLCCFGEHPGGNSAALGAGA